MGLDVGSGCNNRCGARLFRVRVGHRARTEWVRIRGSLVLSHGPPPVLRPHGDGTHGDDVRRIGRLRCPRAPLYRCVPVNSARGLLGLYRVRRQSGRWESNSNRGVRAIPAVLPLGAFPHSGGKIDPLRGGLLLARLLHVGRHCLSVRAAGTGRRVRAARVHGLDRRPLSASCCHLRRGRRLSGAALFGLGMVPGRAAALDATRAGGARGR